MSEGIHFLHSHSGLERMVNDKDIKNKSHVLVDEKCIGVFSDVAHLLKPFYQGKTKYYKVPTLLFARRGGVFKNLQA